MKEKSMFLVFRVIIYFTHVLAQQAHVRNNHFCFLPLVEMERTLEDSVNKYSFLSFKASFRVVPRSCSGLSACKGREIQMRLQFNHHNKDHKDDLIKKHLKKELNELRNGHHSVCCRMCGSAVLSPDK